MLFVRFQSKFHHNRTIFRPHGVKHAPHTLVLDPEPFKSLNGQKLINKSILYILCQVSVQISSKSNNIQTSYGVKHVPHTLLLDPEPFMSLKGQKLINTSICMSFVRFQSKFHQNRTISRPHMA